VIPALNEASRGFPFPLLPRVARLKEGFHNLHPPEPMMTMAVSPISGGESVTAVTGVCVGRSGGQGNDDPGSVCGAWAVGSSTSEEVKEVKGVKGGFNFFTLSLFTSLALRGRRCEVNCVDKACRAPENRSFVEFFSQEVFP